MTHPATTWIVRAAGEPTDGAVSALAKLLLASVDGEQETREHDDGVGTP